MPKRPNAHVIGDKATAKVQDVCFQCDWANEVVHKDYGDDILVQPSLNGEMDHNRIWIQVKGAENLEKSFYTLRYGYSIEVPYDHILKWIRSADLTIVVLWDVGNNWGLWNIPKDAVNTSDLHSLRNGKYRLVFQADAKFDTQQLMKIGWHARIDHYFGLISSTVSGEKHADSKFSSGEIALDFLRLIGIVNNAHLSESTTQYQSFVKPEHVQSYERILSELRSNS